MSKSNPNLSDQGYVRISNPFPMDLYGKLQSYDKESKQRCPVFTWLTCSHLTTWDE